MADWVANFCGGTRWRTLPGGLIEVEGEGTPAYEPGSADFANLQRTWSNWSGLFRSSADRYGIPVSWVLAMATNETGAWASDRVRQATIISADQGVGIMQITRYPGTTVEQMLDPTSNVLTGAKIIRDKADNYRWELPYIAAAYNAGGVYCSPGLNEWNFRATGNYPRRALKNNNSALMYLGVAQADILSWTLGGALFSGAAALIYLWWRARRR